MQSRKSQKKLGRFSRKNKILQIPKKIGAILKKKQDSANSQPKFFFPKKKQKLLPKKSYNLFPRLSPTKIMRHKIIENIEEDKILNGKIGRKGGKKNVDLKGAGGDYDEIVEKIIRVDRGMTREDRGEIEKSLEKHFFFSNLDGDELD
jgi:cGMP-dependent protein kinase